MSTNEINLRDARSKIGYLVERAEHAGEVTIITRHGHPAAAIVPISLVPQEFAVTTTPATAQELAYAVSITLGDHAADFDIDAIVEEIRASHEGITSIDDIPGEDYWALVERHDTTISEPADVTTYTRTRDEDPDGWGGDVIVMTNRGTEVSERNHVDGIDGTDTLGFSSEGEASEHIRERGVYLESEGYTKQ